MMKGRTIKTISSTINSYILRICPTTGSVWIKRVFKDLTTQYFAVMFSSSQLKVL
ncbi:MAG: hypothetical protein QXZ10_03505 [Sulfolobales archaeon]